MRKVLLILMFGVVVNLIISAIIFAEERLRITEVTASSIYSVSSRYRPQNAIDDSDSTYWLGARHASPWWIMFDAGETCYINNISVLWFSSTYSPWNYDIQVSNNGVDWENVHTGLIGEYRSGGRERQIDRDTRYIRLYINEAYDYACLREFKAFAVISISNPRLIRFQGTLKDGSGMLLEGDFAVSFKLYNVETGGTALWEETQNDVSITEGLLDIELGSVTPLELVFDEQYWLGIEIESDGEMTPRFKLTSVPYAFRVRE